MTSAVAIDLEGVPLATSLRLLLKQLDLIFYVQEDGLVVITSESAENAPIEPVARILEDLESLKKEVGRLGKGASPGRGGRGRSPAEGVPKKASHRISLEQGGAEEAEPAAMTVQSVRLNHALTAQAAETWSKLQKQVDMPFAQETPLADVLAFIKSETRSDKSKEVPIYVDPIALAEAEKTPSSVVQLDVPGLSLARGLELMLRQVGLKYYVQDDGILIITAESHDTDVQGQRLAKILEEITSLRLEVQRIQQASAGPR